MTEILLHNIRNKMQGAQNLISLVEIMFENKDDEVKMKKTLNYMKQSLPDAKESMKYIRELKL